MPRLTATTLRQFAAVAGLLAAAILPGAALGQGMLAPVDIRFRPLPITYQSVNVVIHDQASETRIEQEFRNDANVPLEAFYLFPLPEKAGVKDFAMTVDGKRVKGEMVEAGKARQVYEDIVRRTRDPGLLEHMGKNLWRVRVFPVPAHGRQKFELTYTEVTPFDSGIASYTYPLKTSNEAVKVDGHFVIRVELHSTPALKSVYSPTHSVGVSRDGEHKAIVGFEEHAATLNRDFQLFWTVSDNDVGLSLITHRDSPGEAGYFMLLVSPKVEIPKEARVPRDMVFVLDTSGSMREEKMSQARKALEFCLKALDKSDRFGVISFATTVNPYARDLKGVNDDSIRDAVDWVRKLEAGGGTAIADALEEALRMRTSDSRNFTVVFLTDGQPTIGETDPTAILKFVASKNTAQTRIFTFGVGDDVNTHLLDQMADQTQAVSVYVRPKEDLEVKVSSFYDKIRHPVLANLTLDVDGDKRFTEMYPPKLPDLFHGGQLAVLGRYTGKGELNVRLRGKIGDKEKEFIYRASLPEEKRDNDFLPSLWARRKVGYLLDQIRLKGENSELRDEVIFLAKRYGIATPYTSYLVVPDQAINPRSNWGLQPPAGQPQARGDMPIDRLRRDAELGRDNSTLGADGAARAPAASAPGDKDNYIRELKAGDVGIGQSRGSSNSPAPAGGFGGGTGGGIGGGGGGGLGGLAMGRSDLASGDQVGRREKPSVHRTLELFAETAKKDTQDDAKRKATAAKSLASGQPMQRGKVEENLGKQPEEQALNALDFNPPANNFRGMQGLSEAGENAVDLTLALKRMKEANGQQGGYPVRTKAKATFVQMNGVWIDRGYKEGLKSVTIQYLSDAYFRLLEKVATAKDVFSLGEQVVWVTPSGTVLVVDRTGKEKLNDGEIAALFPTK